MSFFTNLRAERLIADIKAAMQEGSACTTCHSPAAAGARPPVHYTDDDRNGDGIGDTPYELYSYADQIWIETPAAQFFKTSPVLELLDFLERLAPFSSPELQLRDRAPRFAKPERTAKS